MEVVTRGWALHFRSLLISRHRRVQSAKEAEGEDQVPTRRAREHEGCPRGHLKDSGIPVSQLGQDLGQECETDLTVTILGYSYNDRYG